MGLTREMVRENRRANDLRDVGAGYDQIDTAACTAAGIHVSNVPTAVNDATADTALFLLLGALRSFNAPLLSLRKGEWRGNPPPP